MSQQARQPVSTAYEQAINQAKVEFVRAAERTGLDWQAEAMFAMQACASNDYLTKVANGNPFSMRTAMVNVAAIGLSLNPATQYAFLVPRDNKVIVDISYRGLIRIATDTGSVLWAKAELVYKADKFEWRGTTQEPVHHYDPFDSNRGDLLGAYCKAKTVDGEILVEAMSLQEIYKVRDKSKAFENEKGPWIDWFEEMVKKTVIKRASKTWPKTDVRLHRAIQYLNEDAGEGLRDRGDVEASIESGEVIPPESAIHPFVIEWMDKVLVRATQTGAWNAARDYVNERLQGSELVWAHEKIRGAAKAATE